MFCKNCGTEIPAGEYCNSCKLMSVSTPSSTDKVNPSVTKRLLIFGLLALVPLATLFINIIEFEVMGEKGGFSFYKFVTTIADFECFDGTEYYIFAAMFLMLIGTVKLLSASINALMWSTRRDKLKKAYKGLYKWCEGFGILSLIAMGINYYGHSSAFKDISILGISLEDIFEISIPAPFIILSVLSIILGIVVKVFYKQDEMECM